VEAMTTENINGENQRIKAKFAKYDSIEEAFDAHAKLLATGKAYAEARKHEDDPEAFADSLTGKYATDPQYGEKLKKLMTPQASITKSLGPGPQIDKGLNTGAQSAV